MIKNLNVLTGPAGSGKTTRVIEKIGEQLKSGKKVFYIVPEPSAVIAESRISVYAKEKGIPTANLDILSFKRLCNEYRRLYGGIAGSVPSKSLKAVLMWRAFNGSLASLNDVYSTMKDNITAFVPTLLRQAEEFNRYGVTPADLEKAADGLPEGRLRKKTRELAVIFSNYNALLKSNDVYTDDISELADGMRANGFFDGSCVYLDGFSGFTGAEYRIIGEMIRASSEVNAVLCCESGRNELFSNVKSDDKRDDKNVYSRLKALCTKIDPSITVVETEFTRQRDYYSDDISYIEENLLREDYNGVFDAEKYEKKTDFVAIANPYEEAEYVACDILRQIRDENKSPRDFAVITANAEYLSLVCSALEKHKIPVHRSAKTPLAETPLFRFIISALKVNENGWEREEIVSLIKTGFLKDITDADCDLLDDYLKTWGLNGKDVWGEKWEFNPFGFTDKNGINGEKIPAVLDNLNKTREIIYTKLSGFCDLIGKKTVKEILSALYSFLKDEGIPNVSDADEVRAFNALVDCLEALDVSVGDLTPGATWGFLELFMLSVTGASIGSIPEYYDEVLAVPFGNVYGRTKVSYIVGCANGLLPAMPSENGLFTDSDKLDLEGSDIILSPTVERMITENNYNFYRAICTGKERLTFTRPLSGNDGEKYIESELYKAIRTLLKRDETEKVPDDFWVQDKVSAKECAGLYRGTPLGEACADAGEEKLPLVCGSETLAPETLKTVFGDEGKDLTLSPSRIESFSKCPFMDACSRILGLRKKLIATETGLSLEANEAGTFTHYILENYFKQKKVTEKLSNKEFPFDGKEISDDVHGFIEKYKENVLGKSGIKYLGDKALHDLDKFESQSVLLIEAMLKHFEKTSFVPRFFEYKISKYNGDGKPLEVVLDNGKKILLGGSVDRIDTYENGGEVYFRVIDYKRSNKALDSEKIDAYIEDGISLQMLIYLFALENDGGGKLLDGKNGHATGVVYVPTSTAPKTDDYKEQSREEIVADVGEAIALTGIYDQEYENEFEEPLTRKSKNAVSSERFDEIKEKLTDTVKAKAGALLSGEASASPIAPDKTANKKSPCEFCDYKSICRRMNVKEEEE